MNYLLHLLVYFEIYVIVAMSLNLLIGYGGLLQVAHAAYFGVGAYASALLSLRFGLGFLPALSGAALISGEYRKNKRPFCPCPADLTTALTARQPSDSPEWA